MSIFQSIKKRFVRLETYEIFNIPEYQTGNKMLKACIDLDPASPALYNALKSILDSENMKRLEEARND